MTAVAQEFSTDIRAHYGALDMYLTPDGENFAISHPDMIDSFIVTAKALAHNGVVNRGAYEMIDRGRDAHIYALPGNDNLCVKVASRRTVRSETSSVPNLKLEARFMSQVGSRLDQKPELDIHVPVQYGAIKLPGGTASLQEFIAPPYHSVKALVRRHHRDSPEGALLDTHEAIAFARVRQALGGTALLPGVGDIKGENGQLNGGNLLVHEDDLSDGRLYVIDLIGQSLFRRAYAAGVTAILGAGR